MRLENEMYDLILEVAKNDVRIKVIYERYKNKRKCSKRYFSRSCDSLCCRKSVFVEVVCNE